MVDGDITNLIEALENQGFQSERTLDSSRSPTATSLSSQIYHCPGGRQKIAIFAILSRRVVRLDPSSSHQISPHYGGMSGGTV